jgi:predicted DNA-binding ArsR family transcriptional regulator
MEKLLYTQREAAELLGFQHYRSLNRLIANGMLECIKRPGRNGQKLFTEKHIKDYIEQCKLDVR